MLELFSRYATMQTIATNTNTKKIPAWPVASFHGVGDRYDGGFGEKRPAAQRAIHLLPHHAFVNANDLLAVGALIAERLVFHSGNVRAVR